MSIRIGDVLGCFEEIYFRKKSSIDRENKDKGFCVSQPNLIKNIMHKKRAPGTAYEFTFYSSPVLDFFKNENLRDIEVRYQAIVRLNKPEGDQPCRRTIEFKPEYFCEGENDNHPKPRVDPLEDLRASDTFTIAEIRRTAHPNILKKVLDYCDDVIKSCQQREAALTSEGFLFHHHTQFLNSTVRTKEHGFYYFTCQGLDLELLYDPKKHFIKFKKDKFSTVPIHTDDITIIPDQEKNTLISHLNLEIGSYESKKKKP